MSNTDPVIRDRFGNPTNETLVSRANQKRMPFKHFAPQGTEFCSGRIGWPSKKTPNPTQVTCKSCLKAIELRNLAFVALLAGKNGGAL